MNDRYESPFGSRYASKEMQYIFSPDKKFKTWRRLWIALARAEHKLGLPVTAEQVAQLEEFKDDINYDVARAKEKEIRHDVMSHVYAYGVQAPLAKPIIHLGATSCYVGDNTDIIIMREGLLLIRQKLLTVLKQLSDFADEYKELPCLGYTHLQPAQLTTVGKRATLWINEFLMDLDDLDYRISHMQLLGSKGTTGTQASFLDLFEGDINKIYEMERMIAAEFDFDDVVPVSGQTYSRKVDAAIAATLSGIAQSAYKFAGDLRVLQSFKEMEEPFGKMQVGSSAMPYKRNPMRSERICALARYIIVDALNPAITTSLQFFERTLDDSANKRIAMAEAFLATDGMLDLLINVTNGMVVYPKVVTQRIMKEIPFMASENIMMEAVKRGGDRQELHEKIRTYSMEAARQVKEFGLENDLLDRISADPTFGLSKEEIEEILVPSKYIGCCKEQVERFLKETVAPKLDNVEMISATINV